MITGNAASLAALATTIQTVLTANGWTLSGSVLHKGNVYIKLTAVSATMLTVTGGTGIDGSNNLTGVSAGAPCIRGDITGHEITFPVTYDIHINTGPDEVYCLINYNANHWQWLAFGQSSVAALPGTGAWFGASFAQFSLAVDPISIYASGGGNSGNNHRVAPALFWDNQSASSSHSANTFINHGLDGLTWGPNVVGSGFDQGGASAPPYLDPLIARMPNAWNGETTLLPYQAYVARPSSKFSLVADLKHARIVRVNNLNDGDIITLGPDQWKTYPFYIKNSVVPNAGQQVRDSGTFGWALRYVAP